jgi:hypothetical protein
MKDAVPAQSPSGEPLSSERGALTIPDGIALAAAAMAARQNAPAPGRVEGAAGTIAFDAALYAVLAEDDLPPGKRPEAVLAAGMPAAQHPAAAEEAAGHPGFRGGDPR